LKKNLEGELSDEDLEDVAGGFAITVGGVTAVGGLLVGIGTVLAGTGTLLAGGAAAYKAVKD
jgi:uncharacterized membrane protein YedE/YeeE